MYALQMLSVTFMTAANDWSLDKFLTNAKDRVDVWFGLVVALLGVVALGVSIWQIVTGLMSQGKKQTNWAVAGILFVVGGALFGGGGWKLAQTMAGGGEDTIRQLGTPGAMIHLLDVGALLSILPF